MSSALDGAKYDVTFPWPSDAPSHVMVDEGWVMRSRLAGCEGRPIVVELGDGWLGDAWLEELRCPAPPDAPEPAPERHWRHWKPHGPLAAPLGVERVGWHGGKPPLETHEVDVRLRNDAAGPRWFLLPEHLGEPVGKRHDEPSITARRLEGSGRVAVVQITGYDAQAVLLPAGADVVLEHLAVESWFYERTTRVTFEVVIAEHLRWNGRDLEDTLAESRLASPVAEVEECLFDGPCAWIGVEQPATSERSDVTYHEVGRLRAELALGTLP